MNRIAWSQLLRLGLTDLGLRPDVFWSLTPVELMLMAGLGETRQTLTRAAFLTLAARFPDSAIAHDDGTE
ncbi:MAG: phage tail assembly chaperone [Rhodobacteraceae bacterium]|nr:phage tail assembly chaperone [Paracoccaceae bacterium]